MENNEYVLRRHSGVTDMIHFWICRRAGVVNFRPADSRINFIRPARPIDDLFTLNIDPSV